MLILSFVLLVVSNVPAGLRLATIMAMSEGCVPPKRIPANASIRVVADLRDHGNSSRFSASPVNTWIDQTIAMLLSETDPTRDLIVYVHGFRSTLADATCAGDVLRTELAELPTYAQGDGPDVFVFGWPGEFWPWQFSEAQDNAARAGAYLAGVLQGLRGRRTILIAHSLGAEVVMTAATKLPETDGAPLLAGLLLIQGAVPAVSIRDWRSTFTLTYPSANLDDIRKGKQSREAYVETKSGSGKFVVGAANAAHLVVTLADDDITLGNVFVLDEAFISSGRNGPIVPSDFGLSRVDIQAVGIPFPDGKIYHSYDLTLHDLQKDILSESRDTWPDSSEFRPADPSRVGMRSEWVFEFNVPHPSYHEIRLDDGGWWRPLFDWHTAIYDPAILEHILSESWAVFGQ